MRCERRESNPNSFPQQTDTYPFGGKPSKARQPLLRTNRPTDQLASEELIYSQDRACLLNNIFEVWQNLAPFGSRPIGGVVKALLTQVVNWQYGQSPIVVFCTAAVT
jgi:hypothetical protein